MMTGATSGHFSPQAVVDHEPCTENDCMQI